MKSGFVLLAAMMAMEAKATLDINVQSCKIQKNIEKDQLQCPCVGGSGDYDWHFKQLPQGWKHENGRLFNDKGRFDDKKVFGAKVELFDKKTKQTLKRSLFFHFQNGQVAKAADGDYDIDIIKLAQTKKNGLNNWGLWGTAQTNNNSFVNGFDRIKKVFDGAEAIGGGGGLGKIRPFFGKGFYREENNPFVKNIPEQQEIEKAIQSEKSSNIRELVVNTVQGKNQCKNTAKFLERLFLRYRAKIAFYKDDVEKTKKNIKSTEEQIAFIEKELKKISENDVNIKTYVGQLQEFRDQAATIDNDRMKLQATLKEANQQIETMQIQIAKNIEIVNRNKKNDEIRKQNIAKIDQELAQLQSRIEKLSNQKAAFVAEADSQKVQLTQANSKIDETKVKVQAIRITISDITNKIKQLNQNYESIQSKIAATDKNIKIAGGEQSPQKLNARLADNKRKLEELKGILVKNEPVYTDYVNNYDDILLVKQNKLDECYKNIFEDDEKQFSDDEDGIKFDGREKLDKYIKKIYGKGLKNDQKILTTPADQDKPIEIKIDTKVQLPKQINLADVKIDNQKHGDKQQNKLNGRHQEDQDREKHENTIKLKRTHIFARAWTKAHGSPYDDIFDEYRGRRFAEQDQECDVASLVNTNAFSGKIVSINKNVAKVLNDQGEVCTLYLAGCTKIETANKPLPQAGDSVYWKGKEKRGKEFDTTQMTCL